MLLLYKVKQKSILVLLQKTNIDIPLQFLSGINSLICVQTSSWLSPGACFQLSLLYARSSSLSEQAFPVFPHTKMEE